MKTQAEFGELLSFYIHQSGYSERTVSKRSGVRYNTLRNWITGDVKRPRHWQPIVKIGQAIHLDRNEINELLEASGHKSLEALVQIIQKDDEHQDFQLISHWIEQQEVSPAQNGHLTELDIVDDLPIVDANTSSQAWMASSISPPQKTYTHFQGRLAELEQLCLWLTTEDTRIISLSGLSGIGKSSLTIEASHQVAEQFSNRIIRLSAYEMSNFDLNSIAAAILCKTAQDIVNNPEDPTITLQAYLHRYPTLIILDDLSHISEEICQQIIKYLCHSLPENGSKAILIAYTYDELFALLSGWSFAQHLNISGLDIDEAIILVQQLTKKFQIPFDYHLIQPIIKKTSGNPKLIEAVVGIAKRRGWHRTHEIVSSAGQDLHAVIEKILTALIQCLHSDSIKILYRLPIFPTPTFLLDEMKIITPTDVDIGSAMDELIDLTVVNFDPHRNIYAVHQLIVLHIAKYLACQIPDIGQARIQLASAYTNQLSIQDTSSDTIDDKFWLENVIGIAYWCLEAEEYTHYIFLVLALVPYLKVRGMYPQGVQLLSTANDIPKQRNLPEEHIFISFYQGELAYFTHNFKTAIGAFQQFINDTKDMSISERATAFHHLAIIHSYPRANWYSDEEVDTIPLYEEAIHLRQQLGENLLLAYTLTDLGYELFQKRQHAQAKARIERALNIAEGLKKTTKEEWRIWGIILRTIAQYYRDRHQLEDAELFYSRSIENLKKSEHYWELGTTYSSYAEALENNEELEQAEDILLKNITTCENFGFSNHVAGSWIRIGKYRTIMERFEDAELAFQNALHQTALLSEGYATQVTYTCEFGLGRLESRRGNYRQAVDYLVQSFKSRQVVGHDHNLDSVFEELVRAASRLQPVEEALRILDWCVEMLKNRPESRIQTICDMAQNLKINLERAHWAFNP